MPLLPARQRACPRACALPSLQGGGGGSGENSPQAAAAFAGGQQHDESVAAAAAKVLTAKMPGSMAVRAYLQLSSLKKAPPEVNVRLHETGAIVTPP